jgi:uncharacterized protein (TIGR03435 family)
MSSDERVLGELVDRDLPWPTQMEVVAARDRVLDQLRATREHRFATASREAAALPRVSHAVNSRRSWTLAAAVALVIAAVGGAIVWPRGGVRVYAAGNDGLQVTLADNSRVEMRAHAEMAVARATDGIQIDLKKGDIIVAAAKQRREKLSVRTNDMTVAVNGTAFLASDGQQGSRVAVIEGEVRVRETGVETMARRAVAEDIAWSRHADAHLAALASFQKSIIDTAGHREPLNQTPATAQGAAAATTPPQFEEASVRPCDPDNLPPPVPGTRGGGGGGTRFSTTPGRTIAVCMTLATLIRHAHGYKSVEAELKSGAARWLPAAVVHESLFRPRGWNTVTGFDVEDGRRVRGGPDWVRTERYTIEAVADGAANAETMSGPMLRALLEQRFKLKAHIETEPVPALALVVAPGGLKIKPAAPDSCTPVKQLGGRAARYTIIEGQVLFPNFEEGPKLADLRRGQKPVCGQLLKGNGPNRVLVAGGSTFSALAQVLGMREFVGPVRVVDRTGITGTFNWILEFAPEEDRGPSSPTEPTNVPPGPRIFDVLQQQLGLRLEPTQAPRDVIVIDTIERPSPN